MSDLRIGAMILAAGESRRMGYPKPLLMLHGENFINTLTQTVEKCRLDPIVVVTGFRADEVEKSLKPVRGLKIVRNTRWKEGQGTSIAAGVEAFPADIKAIIIMLVDQPRVSTELLHMLVKLYTTTSKPIIITMSGGYVTPPTLMDSTCFEDLKRLKGDEGAKKLLKTYEYKTCLWERDDSLADIDTPEAYAALKGK